MIIDCHGHYTTAPAQLQEFRDAQLARLADPSLPERKIYELNARRVYPRLGARLRG